MTVRLPKSHAPRPIQAVSRRDIDGQILPTDAGEQSRTAASCGDETNADRRVKREGDATGSDGKRRRTDSAVGSDSTGGRCSEDAAQSDPVANPDHCTGEDTENDNNDGPEAASNPRSVEPDVTLLQKLIAEREGSADRWRARKAESTEFVVAAGQRLRERNVAHLDVSPVYLGHCAAYCDCKYLVPTGRLHRQIVAEFRRMTEATFEYHPLRSFFEPRVDSDGSVVGYAAKTYVVNGRTHTVLSIDHVLPRYWDPFADGQKKKFIPCFQRMRSVPFHPQSVGGGTDHPRNYVAMHAGLNGSFGERLPECKLSYVESHSPSALRRVHAFVTELRTSPLSVAADHHYVAHVMRSWISIYGCGHS
jgi:hypothetical protein